MCDPLIHKYHTNRKVFAEGARVSEIPLQKPKSKLADQGAITSSQVRKSRRQNFRMLKTAVPGYAPISLDSNDPETVECGFKQRLLRDLPEPDIGILQEFKAFVTAFVAKIPVVAPMTFEEWLESTNYDGTRKAQLTKAHDSLRGGRPTKKQCSHIDTFVKTEAYPEYKHARMINSRCDVFKAFSGRYFKAIENEVYKLPEFIKHVPVPERPSKIRALKQNNRRYFQTDFTAFESHFCLEFMNCCESILYTHCLSGSTDGRFISSVISGINNMRTRTGIKARVRARRMSGDMCTSLGNGFSNLMLAKFIAFKKNGNIEGFVEGDDGLFSCDFELTADDYKSLGFTIKIDEIDDPCKGSFCGMIFSESGQIIRDPRRFFASFGWTHSCIHGGDNVMAELLKAKSLSACHETPSCPVVGALARYGLNISAHAKPRFVQDGYHEYVYDVEVPEFEPTNETRLLFEEIFGVSVENQIYIETQIMDGNLDCIQDFIEPHPHMIHYIDRFVMIT